MNAAPVAEAAPPPLVSGFKVDWVQVSTSPHTIGNALDALAGTGGFTIIDTFSEYRSSIDLSDATVPFGGGDPIFAIRISGYLTLGDGSYQFASLHDDGLRLTVGGEDVIVFDSDTAPTVTTSAVFGLTAGVYAFEAISWEQGGIFELEIGTMNAAGAIELLPGFHAAAVAVPEPGSLALVGLALVGLAGTRRRRAR